MKKTLIFVAVVSLVGIGCDAHVQLGSEPLKKGESTGVPDRPEHKTVAGEAFKKATEMSTGQKAEAAPVEAPKNPLDKTAVESIEKHEKGDWFLLLRLLSSYASFECDVDEVTVVFDKSLDGTYVSATDYSHNGMNTYYLKGVVLYVSTPENNRNWNIYLKKMRDRKKAAESPREVIPPGYIKILPDKN